jgi:hypothetical protein
MISILALHAPVLDAGYSWFLCERTSGLPHWCVLGLLLILPHLLNRVDFHKVFVCFAKTSIKGPILLGSSITEIGTSCLFQSFGNDK